MLLRLLVVLPLLVVPAVTAEAQLTVLETTGDVREGLPVVRPHPDAAAVLRVLERGYSGRLLHLHRLEQEFLRRKTGRPPEPAYLVLSDRTGGFARIGFCLGDEKKPGTGWVDLRRGSRLSGRFGAVDQIFPHELLHVMMHQLVGDVPASGANQVHAVGVRTDPVVAFNEGFAEHAQVMSVDDPDASSDTRALPGDATTVDRARRELAAYRRDLGRTWWPIQPSRLRFLSWFGQTEQVQRYHAVKANLFSRTPDVPAALLAREDRYAAYLIASVVPALPGDPPKPVAAALATEGVVAHLVWRLATDESLRRRYRDDEFYTAFGASRRDITPQDNVYLKMFAVLSETRAATAAEMIRGWMRVHPEDAADLDRILRETLNGQSLPDAPEIWLANDALITGTSLFDQYRALPRPHTFDINAAMPLDWISVPGISSDAAARLIAGAPYANLQSLLASPALPETATIRVREMAAAMDAVRSASIDESSLSLSAIAAAYIWRFGAIVLGATAAGAGFTCRTGVERWWTALIVAFASTMLVVTLAWVIVSPPWYPLVAPVAIGGAPWALWRLVRRRGVGAAAMCLASWLVAGVPAMIITNQW